MEPIDPGDLAPPPVAALPAIGDIIDPRLPIPVPDIGEDAGGLGDAGIFVDQGVCDPGPEDGTLGIQGIAAGADGADGA
jgi:hypothetical protein